MSDHSNFHIDGKWVRPAAPKDLAVTNPATQEMVASISIGSVSDVDHAVAAASRAFETYSETTFEERLALLRRIIEIYKVNADQMAQCITREMGAPVALARKAQVPAGLAHLTEALP